jgi:hypothetical protein
MFILHLVVLILKKDIYQLPYELFLEQPWLPFGNHMYSTNICCPMLEQELYWFTWFRIPLQHGRILLTVCCTITIRTAMLYFQPADLDRGFHWEDGDDASMLGFFSDDHCNVVCMERYFLCQAKLVIKPHCATRWFLLVDQVPMLTLYTSRHYVKNITYTVITSLVINKYASCRCGPILDIRWWQRSCGLCQQCGLLLHIPKRNVLLLHVLSQWKTIVVRSSSSFYKPHCHSRMGVHTWLTQFHVFLPSHEIRLRRQKDPTTRKQTITNDPDVFLQVVYFTTTLRNGQCIVGTDLATDLRYNHHVTHHSLDRLFKYQ